MKRIDEKGDQALVKLPTPIDNFPAFVASAYKPIEDANHHLTGSNAGKKKKNSQMAAKKIVFQT